MRNCLQAPKYLGFKSKNEIKIPSPIPLWKLAADTGPYVRLAAFSGAAAVILNGYGFYSKIKIIVVLFEMKFCLERILII